MTIDFLINSSQRVFVKICIKSWGLETKPTGNKGELQQFVLAFLEVFLVD